MADRPMRGLSLWQPWAQLVALGDKTIETRPWGTPHRGTLAIHATKAFPEEAQEACFHGPIMECLMAAGFETPRELPRGVIVAVARLVDVKSMGNGTCTDLAPWVYELPQQERELGNYAPRRFGWLLDTIRPLAEPVPCRGAQGLWDVPADVAAAIERQFAAGRAG